MEKQLNSFSEQAKILGEIYTKAAEDAVKVLFGTRKWLVFMNPTNHDFNSPLVKDASNKLIRRLSNDEKRAHQTDLNCGHLIDQVCTIMPPEQ